jgi:hypothetical protein
MSAASRRYHIAKEIISKPLFACVLGNEGKTKTKSLPNAK